MRLQGQTDSSMSAELKQVADGFGYRVKSFNSYDVNGYLFHTMGYEQSWPNRRTTNTRVFTLGQDGVDYYGRLLEIYETPVSWFHTIDSCHIQMPLVRS